ncbi:MAG: hypothetical protein WCE54_10670 [Ignavibacteriaceae bacterium]
MDYTIDYNRDGDFANINVKGKLSFKQAEKYSVEAVKLAHQNNCHKYLFNHKETKLDCSGIYKLYTNGEALEKFGFKTNDKIAIVISRIKDDHLFFEKIEHNAKWSNFKYFDSVKEALIWLNSGN